MVAVQGPDCGPPLIHACIHTYIHIYIHTSTHLGLTARFLLDSFGFVDVGRPLTRGRVYRLKLLLVLASVVILWSESLRTRVHILLSQIRDFPFRRLLRPAGVGIVTGYGLDHRGFGFRISAGSRIYLFSSSRPALEPI
jgi:hypothetical protein